MARNYVGEGDVLDYTTGGAAALSGAVVAMSKRIGIVLGDIPANSTGSVGVTGVWTVAKLATDVVNQGDLLYWDAANSRLTVTAGALQVAGYAAAAADNGAATVRIKINA
jgi:predicted RecA/RadA family phage recombinase